MLADRALDAISAAHPDPDGEWCALAAELTEEAGHDQRRAVEVAAAVLRRLAARAEDATRLIVEPRWYDLPDPWLHSL